MMVDRHAAVVPDHDEVGTLAAGGRGEAVIGAEVDPVAVEVGDVDPVGRGGPVAVCLPAGPLGAAVVKASSSTRVGTIWAREEACSVSS